MDAAIGLFHVHAHKEECFYRYASTFIPGAGVVAGEILESLWSSLNSISPTVRTATLAHRAEMLDDHASDSNHKKMLGIISSLCKSNSTALDMSEHAQQYYNNLTLEAGSTAVEKWKSDIEEAKSERQFDIKAMDIYSANLVSDKLKTHELAAGSNISALNHWMELIEEKQ